MKRGKFGFLAVLLFVLQAQAGQSTHRLVSGPGARVLDLPATDSALTQQRRAALERLKGNDSTVEWIRPIHFERGALNHDVVEAYLFDTMVVIRRAGNEIPRDQRSDLLDYEEWHGEVLLPGDPENGRYLGPREATFHLWRDGSVGGVIRVGEQVYKLRGSGPGDYSLSKQDLAKLNKSGDDLFVPETEPSGCGHV